jgi:hypothetical protein
MPIYLQEERYKMGKRKIYNTTLDTDLMREIRILAAQLEKRQNDLLEEAIQDLLKKYKSQNQKEPRSGLSWH